jgi:hypothetical protein
MIIVMLSAGFSVAFSQAETVPAGHPVYAFLKRMEVKRIVERYHDAILPLSRREVAALLNESLQHASHLPAAERGRLRDFLSEFQYELHGSVNGFSTTLGSGGELSDSVSRGFLEPRERYLFLEADSSVSLFVNLLLDVDARRISGDALGYSITATNAQFWGSRPLLARDPVISQSHALGVGNAQNFDFAEGSVRYDAGIASVQLGRERILWGSGYDQKMILSDNARVFDFIRADVSYKALRYSFLHAWLLGSASELHFSNPGDTNAVHTEPVIADKYVAAHRLEFSFPGVMDIGAQEMVIYSNRSVDLGYLTPLSLMESVQRSRGERDNMFWAVDVQTHFLENIEFAATMLYDDINVPDMFTDKWSDRYAWQIGMFYADPFAIANSNIVVEYTRVEPYVFSHGRSRDDSYTSLGAMLGTRIGPNADAMSVRMDYLPLRNLSFSLRVVFERHGMNPLDSTGRVVRNVGGDVLFPFREGIDQERKVFLGGTKYRSRRFDVSANWEIVNQCWFEARYEFDSQEEALTLQRTENHQISMRLRMEL